MNQVALKTLSRAYVQATEMTCQQILNDLRDSQTMPFDEGDMQNVQTHIAKAKTSTGKSSVITIVTDAPQARRLYFHPEYNFQKGKNPNAGAGWFEPYITGEKAAQVRGWLKYFMKLTSGRFVKR
jgi:hypothetical protein